MNWKQGLNMKGAETICRSFMRRTKVRKRGSRCHSEWFRADDKTFGAGPEHRGVGPEMITVPIQPAGVAVGPRN